MIRQTASEGASLEAGGTGLRKGGLAILKGLHIVAHARLHRDRRVWARQGAELPVTLALEYRRKGLAHAPVQKLTDMAGPHTIVILHAEILEIPWQSREEDRSPIFPGPPIVGLGMVAQGRGERASK